MTGKKKKIKFRRRSIIICTFVVLFAAYLVGSVCIVHGKINETRAEIADVKAETELQMMENDEVREKINSKNKDEIIGDEAREKYDFAEQGERIYCSVSASE